MAGFEPGALPPLPHLERLLARADRREAPAGFAADLFALFELESADGADLPTAAVTFLADSGEAPRGYVLQADPLQLLPDRDRLLAFDLDDDPLDEEERDALVAAFNTHFGDDPGVLQSTASGRLYLSCERAPSLRTHPVSSVIGRGLDRYLPEGDDQRSWRSLLNETQMLCHALEVNQRREALGRPVLNGLWFSGGGVLPSACSSHIGNLIGECPLSHGLMALSGAQGNDELTVDHAPGRALMRANRDAWLRALAGIDETLRALLEAGEIVQLHPGDGAVYRWDARAARRFWRRQKPLAAYVIADSAASQ